MSSEFIDTVRHWCSKNADQISVLWQEVIGYKRNEYKEYLIPPGLNSIQKDGYSSVLVLNCGVWSNKGLFF